MKIIKSIIYSVSLACLSITCLASNAMATQRSCITTIRVLGESKFSGSTAHVIDILNTGCPSVCGPNLRAYIEFEDKDLFAMALSAVNGSKSIGIAYDDAAIVKGSTTHSNGQTNCKIKGMWLPG